MHAVLVGSLSSWYILVSDVFQDSIYVNTSDDKSNTTEDLVTAVIPPAFHKCERQGIQPGCKFKFDSPEEQCSERRKGYPHVEYRG